MIDTGHEFWLTTAPKGDGAWIVTQDPEHYRRVLEWPVEGPFVSVDKCQPRPGEMHPIDKAFYELAIKERNYERARVDGLGAENERLRAKNKEQREALRQAQEALEIASAEMYESLRDLSSDPVGTSICEPVKIARCAEHGLHGERMECFVCGGAVEQVEMVPISQLAEAVKALREAIGAARLFNRNGMTWLEYDAELARLERIADGAIEQQ